MAPHTCHFCADLVLSPNPVPGARGFPRFLFNCTLPDVHLWRSSGCDFAKFIFAALLGECVESKVLPIASNEQILSIEVTLSADSVEIEDVYSIGFVKRKQVGYDDGYSTLLGWYSTVSAQTLALYTTEGSPASDFVSCRPINTTPASPENLLLARSWLSGCVSRSGVHAHCKPPQQSSMPTRLLDLDPSGAGIKVVSTTTPEPFAALSYCWGGDQPQELTKANLKDYSLTINPSHLPLTIQDAIKVTRELGLRYLWLDVLCIIQDDAQDVAREISRMPDIYSGALFTISTSRAASASEGFLHPIDLDSLVTASFKLRIRCPNGAEGEVFLLGVADEEDLTPTLYTRGWTLQELYLSPRILEFGTFQMRWICGGSKNVKGFTDGWQKFKYTAPSECEEWQELQHASFNAEEIEHDRTLALSVWRKLVKAYTTAISQSLRIGFSPSRRWLTALDRDRKITTSQVCGDPDYPSIFFGPSWSWVAVNSPVDFFMIDIGKCIVCTVISNVDVQLSAPSAKYGSVDFGLLRLKGHTEEVLWNGNRSLKCLDEVVLEDSMWPDALEDEFVKEDDSDTSESNNSLSGPERDEEEKWISVLLFKVCTVQERRGYNSFALVLRQRNDRAGSPSVVTCTRLGIFRFYVPVPEALETMPIEKKQQCGRKRDLFNGCNEIEIDIY